MAVNAPLNRKLRMGLIGGGQGAFIGAVHMRAAILDKQSTLLNDIENINVSVLKQLKLPSPTNVSRPVSPPKLVP